MFDEFPARITKGVSDFTFKKKQTKKTGRQKAKETKEEKIMSIKNLNGYGDIVCEFALCTCTLLDHVVNFSWFFIII